MVESFKACNSMDYYVQNRNVIMDYLSPMGNTGQIVIAGGTGDNFVLIRYDTPINNVGFNPGVNLLLNAGTGTTGFYTGSCSLFLTGIPTPSEFLAGTVEIFLIVQTYGASDNKFVGYRQLKSGFNETKIQLTCTFSFYMRPDDLIATYISWKETGVVLSGGPYIPEYQIITNTGTLGDAYASWMTVNRSN